MSGIKRRGGVRRRGRLSLTKSLDLHTWRGPFCSSLPLRGSGGEDDKQQQSCLPPKVWWPGHHSQLLMGYSFLEGPAAGQVMDALPPRLFFF